MKIEQSTIYRPESQTTNFKIENWNPADAAEIYRLEESGWAPWLRKSEKLIATIAEKFPDTQLVARNKNGLIVATMTANRINWDGDPSSLKGYDDIVGGSVESSNYLKTYKPDGNTICLIASTVDPRFKKYGLGIKLGETMKVKAIELGVKHLIGPFRPSRYGAYKLENGPIEFEEYCKLTRFDGKPGDPWLRSVTSLGMKPLRKDDHSLTVNIPLEKFEEYKKYYHPHLWKQLRNGLWECGEAGNWSIKGNIASYVEPNLWGEIPL